MNAFFNDIKFSIRQLRKSPGFAAVAIVSLALGIGANTAIFSIINGLLFKPLPVENPEQLRMLSWGGSEIKLPSYSGTGKRLSSGRRTNTSFSYPLYCRLRDEVPGFSEVFAFHAPGEVSAQVNSRATTAEVLMVSGNFFSGYRAVTLLGRPVHPEDEGAENEPVAVLTHRFWEKHYGLDARVLGHVISLNKKSFTVVGILPSDYVGPLVGDGTDVYVPMNTPHKLVGMSLTSIDHWWVQVMARLKPGVQDTQAKAACEVIFRQALTEGKSRVENPFFLIEDGSRGPLVTRERMAKPFSMLLGAVSLVLLIACANVAGLLLSRGSARNHEMAIRAAVGARRWHLMRQCLSESLLLCILALMLGLMLSFWIRQIVVGLFLGDSRGFHLDMGIDVKVLLYTMGLALVTTFLFGLLPAWRLSGVNPLVGLGNLRSQGLHSSRWGNSLVTIQMGLSLLLLVFAGLLVRTLINLQQDHPGFDTEKLLVFKVNAREAGYEKGPTADFYERLREEVATVPGVEGVSFASNALLRGSQHREGFSIPGRTEPADRKWMTQYLRVGDNFFSTLRIPILQGRGIESRDTEDGSPVVVINQCFADTFFPNENPLDQNLDKYRIVGICGNTKYQNVRQAIEPTVYYSHRQEPIQGNAFVMARTTLPPLSLSSTVRTIVSELDVTIPIKDITTQTLMIDDSLSTERLAATLCLSLAGLGLLLAAIGLYGLMSFTVTRRTLEIGLRMAVGACPGDIAKPILRQAFVLALLGIAIGCPVALLVTRVLHSTVYGIETYDPVTLSIGAAILLVVTLLAAWIPVRRATRIDPMEALRYE